MIHGSSLRDCGRDPRFRDQESLLIKPFAKVWDPAAKASFPKMADKIVSIKKRNHQNETFGFWNIV